MSCEIRYAREETFDPSYDREVETDVERQAALNSHFLTVVLIFVWCFRYFESNLAGDSGRHEAKNPQSAGILAFFDLAFFREE